MILSTSAVAARCSRASSRSRRNCASFESSVLPSRILPAFLVLRRLIDAPENRQGRCYRLNDGSLREDCDDRFGSKADICAAKSDVRFTPNSDRKSGFPHKVMSALLPKADMCSAPAYVCFGPKGDIANSVTDHQRRCRFSQCQEGASFDRNKPALVHTGESMGTRICLAPSAPSYSPCRSVRSVRNTHPPNRLRFSEVLGSWRTLRLSMLRCERDCECQCRTPTLPRIAALADWARCANDTTYHRQASRRPCRDRSKDRSTLLQGSL